MPLLYAIEGRSSPYERVLPVAPASEAFVGILSKELEAQGFKPGTKKSTAIKSYVEESAAADLERKPALTASDLMTKHVFSVSSSASLSEALELMHRERIRHVPVLEKNNTLAGILSDRDLLRAGADLQRSVTSEMSVNVLTATPETLIREIAEAMLAHGVHSMPIVDEKLRMTGILTTTDILRAVVKRAPLELWA